MKISFSLIIICFALLSCKFSTGVKKDLVTGLSAQYNGFSIDDIFLADQNGNRLSSNNITLGEPVIVMATGVDNFAEENGYVFPGCSIILTDKNKKELLNLPDAFASLEHGQPKAESKVLQAKLNTGDPMQKGEAYHLDVTIFDKKDPKNKIISGVDIVAK